jgi:hypothetical protein
MSANAKPIVPTTIRTEFGEVLESDAFRDQNGANGDFTYVPGYSDLRRKRDQELKEVVEGKRSEKNVSRLPVRLQWVRSVRVNNTPDNRKPVEFGNQKYRNVTKDDMGKEWFTGLPEGAVVEAGGEIRQGDCTLMVVEAENAARNAAAVQLRTNQMLKDTAAAQLMRLGETKPGSDPSYSASKGDTITVGSSIKQQ